MDTLCTSVCLFHALLFPAPGLLLASPVEPQALRLAAFFERMASYASLLLACCVGMASMHLVFVAQGSPGSSAPQTPSQVSSAQLPGAPDMEENGMAQAALRFRKRPDAWPCAVGLWTAHLCWCGRCGDPCASAASSWLWLALADSIVDSNSPDSLRFTQFDLAFAVEIFKAEVPKLEDKDWRHVFAWVLTCFCWHPA